MMCISQWACAVGVSGEQSSLTAGNAIPVHASFDMQNVFYFFDFLNHGHFVAVAVAAPWVLL